MEVFEAQDDRIRRNNANSSERVWLDWVGFNRPALEEILGWVYGLN